LLIVILGIGLDVSGDFSINDDWGYSTPVRWLAQSGATELTFWQSMPLFTQIAAGAAWSAAFGFDQETLRYLTLSLAGVSVLSIYALARMAGVQLGLAMIVALLPLASPIFMTLSLTFMTDVPGIAWLLMATCAFAASFRLTARSAQIAFAVGAVLCLTAVLLRQTNLGLPVALVMADLFYSKGRIWPAMRSFVVLGASVAVIALVHSLLTLYDAVPATYDDKTGAISAVLSDLASLNAGVIKQPIKSALHFAAYAGLFLLPFVPVLWRHWPQSNGRRLSLAIALSTAVLVLAAGSLGALALNGMVGNVWSSNGAGPHLIEGQYGTGAVLPLVVTALSFAIILSALVVVWLRRKTNADGVQSRPCRSVIVLVGFTGAICYAPHAVAYAALFDRYTLTPALFLAIALAALLPKIETSGTMLLSGAIAAGGILFSAVLVQDHFAWQRARYGLIDQLVATQRIDPDMIDGGFEHNNLGRVLSDFTTADQGILVDASGRLFYLATKSSPDAETLLQVSVPQLWGWSSLEIFALHRGM
jgi:hypothetical protein